MGIFDLIKLLAEKEIDFVLVGGLAVALQGYQRVTMDVDVVLAMDAGNLERFIAAARDAGLRPTIPVPIESLALPELIEQWHREKGMLAFSLRGAAAQSTVLDVLVKPVVPYADLSRRIDGRIGNIKGAGSLDSAPDRDEDWHRPRQGSDRHRRAEEVDARERAMTGEQNLALIRQIEDHRAFLLTVLSQNPELLARAEPRVRELLEPLPVSGEAGGDGNCDR